MVDSKAAITWVRCSGWGYMVATTMTVAGILSGIDENGEQMP